MPGSLVVLMDSRNAPNWLTHTAVATFITSRILLIAGEPPINIHHDLILTPSHPLPSVPLAIRNHLPNLITPDDSLVDTSPEIPIICLLYENPEIFFFFLFFIEKKSSCRTNSLTRGKIHHVAVFGYKSGNPEWFCNFCRHDKSCCAA